MISEGSLEAQSVKLDGQSPNIFWISVEDISPLLGGYGDLAVKTAVIYQLTSEGELFTRAFTTAGGCSPSRTTIIIGMYQSSIDAHHHRSSHTGHSRKTIAAGKPLVSEAVAPHHVVPPATFIKYLSITRLLVVPYRCLAMS